MASQAVMGQKALETGDFDAAIKYFTEALKSSKSPLWLNSRSAAYQRKGLYDKALYDAEDAVLEAKSRGRRELMAAGQFRRGVALFGLKRYGDSRLCFAWARKLNENEKGLGMWQAKVNLAYDKLEDGAEGRNSTVEEFPDKKERSATITSTEALKAEPPASAAEAATGNTIESLSTTPKEKIKYEWYQSSSKVTITILAKNVPKDQVDIRFSPQSLEVSFPTAVAGQTYDFTLCPLYSQVDVDHCTYNVTPSKIEVNLHKTMGGLKWPSLEYHVQSDEGSKGSGSATTTNVAPPIQPSVPTMAPAYPTSSRKGTKDWDAVAKEALKKEKKAEGKDTSDDTGLDDEEEGDPLNGFFRKLYKDASPDTRRAMMKSYIESNGTALSTNWDDVSKKTFPVEPPEGVEAKKWEH